ncbi:DNA primase [Lactobacillus psittaci]|uniref:DNA primase n=1 Tax=Lactobacillus psittaci TaxID=116089 RepID=UPI000407E4F8|nr:DNA primase [Lactobacillus psittaci]
MAGRIPEDFINEVRSNVNIVDVISQYVSLEKKGKDYVGLCPFHQEKTPSFTVSEEKQFFKCFGCGKGGNVFSFMMYKENLTFPEAVEKVAEYANISMPSGYQKEIKPLSPLKKIQQDASDFFHHVLFTTKAGERALKYARERELSEELLEHFQIGYAPNSEKLLLSYLQGKGYSDTDLIQSGLFSQTESGQLHDRFRDRLMFPLTDETGYIVGFSGRRISNNKELAKYLNSPETSIFNKSKVLFHFPEAKKAARSEKHLILYEGYMDVIAAYKAGIKSGIASMGTSLTDEQVYMLKRVTNNIVINYDGDEPGQHAIERASKMFNQVGGFRIGIVSLPENLDPDEYVKKYGVQRYQDEVKGAITPTDFFLKRLEQKYNLANDREKLAYLDEAIKVIAPLSDPVEKDLYIAKLARQAGVTQDSLKVSLLREGRRLRAAKRRKQQYESEEPVLETDVTQQHHQPQNNALMRLLYLFIHAELAREYLLSRKFLFPDESYAKLAELWLNYEQTHDNAKISEFYDFIPTELKGIIDSMEMKEMPKSYTTQEIDDILASLNRQAQSKNLVNLQEQLKDAERRNDQDLILSTLNAILKTKRNNN